MAISFNGIPGNLRVPFAFIEIDNSGAVPGLGQIEYKGLILGQRLSSAPVLAGVPTKVRSADEAASQFGRGGMIHQQAAAWFKANKFTELWVIALDDGAGVSATGTLAFTGPSTAAGAVVAYVAGRRYEIPVASGASASTVATAVAAAINADLDAPVTAAADTGTVTLTCRWKGETGDEIDLRLNYNTGEALPAGIGCTVTAFSGGTVNPSLSGAITAMGDVQYHVIVNPYKDTAALTALKAELDRRWGPTVQKEGVAIMAKDDTVGNLSTFGNGQNNQLLVTLGIKKSPTPAYQIAAVLAAVVALNGAQDPARPFQTLELPGVLPPAEADRFTMTEANTLLYDGISTSYVTPGNVVCIQRLITMYQKNSLGADDPSYLDLTTILTLSFLRYDTRTVILTKYPRHKLADDGVNYGPGQPIVTPKVIKAELVARFRLWEESGLVENADAFKAGLIVERNATDRNRLDVLMDPDLINGFVVAGIKIKFIL